MITKHEDGANVKEIWHCDYRTCKAPVIIQNDSIVLESGNLAHAVVNGKATIDRALAGMKRLTEETEEIAKIVQRALYVRACC